MCSRISAHLGTSIFIMMVLPVSQLPNDHAVVKVNDPALLTCSRPCPGDVKWMLAKRPEILVRDCKQGTCVEGQGFEKRTRLEQGEPSLHLDSVTYNDKGWYICYCHASKICQFHLDVVFPHLKSACVGSNVTIPCYAETDKRIPDDDVSVQWEKDGDVVVKLQQGTMSYGAGLEGRSFITVSQYKNGDLSLTLLKIQRSDGGTYRCSHRHGEAGQPEAVTLRVRESSECEAAKQSTSPWWGCLLLGVATAAIFCVGGLLYKYKNTSTARKRPQSDAVDDARPMITSYSNVVP